MNKIITLFIILISLKMSALAQNAAIQGRITDGSGQPLPQVHVWLKEIKKGASTDEKGVFSFVSLQARSYTLQASFVGFSLLEKKISLKQGQTLELSLQLTENSQQLDEVTVKDYASSNEKEVSLAKLNIKPMDLPQSIAVIDRQILDNQQILRMSEVLMNTNGVYIMGTTGGYQEEISSRGFAYGSSNTFKNGARYFNGIINELSGIERVEIMKGSAAILFGNVAAGGILNLISKRPKFDFGGEVSLRTGSFGMWKPSFDVYGGIGKSQKMAFRLNGSYEKAGSFRQGVSSERYFVNPSLLFKLNPKTELLLEFDYLADQRTPDFGAGIINYQLVDLPRERFVGVAWSYFKAQQMAATATVTHRFSDRWKLKGMLASRSYQTDVFANTRPNAGALISQDGTWIRNLQRSEVSEDYYMAQLDLNGQFNTGAVSHQVLLGMDADRYNTLTTAYNQMARYDTINIFGNKEYRSRTDIPNMTAATLTTAPINRMGIYLQDLISLGKKIKLLAGIRYSYQQTQSDVLTYATQKTTSSINFDGAFSPRLGVVYQPTKNHSIFGSYANSFTLNTGVDINGNSLAPSLIDQYEIGVKNELFKGKLSVNLTAYSILNKNMAQASLVNGNTYTYVKELAGSVQSQGLEIDLTARPIQGLFLMAGYSFNETKYLRSNIYIEGSLLRYNPNHTFNASANYRLEKGRLKGLSVGLTSVYIGQRYAGRSTRLTVANDAYRIVELPDYLQIDGTLSYTFKSVSLRAKVGNLFNALSYNVHDDNSVNPIAPRNYSTTLVFRF
jgi:iron complex outermembrane recepter protein